MRERFRITSTGNANIVYTHTERNWKKCIQCNQKLLEVIEPKGSVVEVKCRRCGSVERIEI